MNGSAVERMRHALGPRLRAIFHLAPFERILLGRTRGRPYSGLRARLTPLPVSYPRDSFRMATRHGCRLRLDLSDLVDWYVYWGFLDPSHDAIVHQCGKGMTVLDVGANRGTTAIRLAHATGPTGHVIALEPDPENYEVLCERLRSNGLTWVTPLKLAAAERSTTLHLAPRDQANSGMHQVSDAGVEVQSITLDDLVTDMGLATVDLIKIDVEGFEARVIEGASRTIKEHRPKLVIEVSPENLAAFGANPTDLLDQVRDLGYSIVDSVTGEPKLPDRQFDALALPSEA